MSLSQRRSGSRKDALDELFRAPLMLEYIDRMNVLVLQEIAKGHIQFKLNENSMPRVMINKHEAFRADFSYSPTNQVFVLEVRMIEQFMNVIYLKWNVSSPTNYTLSFQLNGATQALDETTLAHVLLMLCIFREFRAIPGVDLTFRGTLRVPDRMVGFDYFNETGNAVAPTYMTEIQKVLPKFKAFIKETMPMEHEEQLTDDKRRIGEMLVKQIMDAYKIQQTGGVRRKRKNVKGKDKSKVKPVSKKS